MLQLLHFTLPLYFVVVRHQLELVSYLTLKFLASSSNYWELPLRSWIAKRKPECFTPLHCWIYSFVQQNKENAVKFLQVMHRVSTIDLIINVNLESFLVIFIYASAIIWLASVYSEVNGISVWNQR